MHMHMHTCRRSRSFSSSSQSAISNQHDAISMMLSAISNHLPPQPLILVEQPARLLLQSGQQLDGLRSTHARRDLSVSGAH